MVHDAQRTPSNDASPLHDASPLPVCLTSPGMPHLSDMMPHLSLHASPLPACPVSSQVHQFGQYGPEVVKALAHIHELQTGYFANDPDMIKHMDLIQKGTTPSER